MELFHDHQSKEGLFFAPDELPDELRSLTQAIVTVDCGDRQMGSGFFVRSALGSSYLISAEHCFRPREGESPERKVTFQSGVEIPITHNDLVGLPPELLADLKSSGDLIVHKVDLAESLDLPTLASNDPTKEDVESKKPFLLMGYPSDYIAAMEGLRVPYASVGIITNLFEFFPDEMKTTARGAPGMSGCPMINESREVAAFLTGCDFLKGTDPTAYGPFAKRMHKMSSVVSATSILNKYQILM